MSVDTFLVVCCPSPTLVLMIKYVSWLCNTRMPVVGWKKDCGSDGGGGDRRLAKDDMEF